MKLSKQPYQVVLAGCLFPEAGAGVLPKLIDSPPPVHATYNHVARRRQAVSTSSRVIMQNVPTAAAIAVPAN
jgi:hypothetical protein